MKNRMHFFDYEMYENGFGSQEMRDLWSERGILQQWVDFEVYLAQAQAELGMIPQKVADEITKKGNIDLIGTDKIA